jgi:hypothetical protein
MAGARETNGGGVLKCAFCGKSQNDVQRLIRGPTVHICDECVDLCNDILDEERDAKDGEAPAVVDPRESATAAGPLAIRHTPLSREDVSQDLIDRLRQSHYRYLRFYRTEVTNTSDRPIRIVWFDGFVWYRGEWTASNVRNKVLRTPDFTDWYGGDGVGPGGWLQPGATASCRVNWHYTHTPADLPVKWAYLGVDAAGNDYFGEGMVPPIRAERLGPRSEI